MRNNVTKLAVALVMGWLAFNAVPALAQYHQVNLTGYQPGMGRFLDPKLNGGGMLSLADGSFCLANTSTGVDLSTTFLCDISPPIEKNPVKTLL